MALSNTFIKSTAFKSKAYLKVVFWYLYRGFKMNKKVLNQHNWYSSKVSNQASYEQKSEMIVTDDSLFFICYNVTYKTYKNWYVTVGTTSPTSGGRSVGIFRSRDSSHGVQQCSTLLHPTSYLSFIHSFISYP
jgi:hypothetical protein